MNVVKLQFDKGTWINEEEQTVNLFTQFEPN